ncbi:hypothetical protein NEOLI_003713 [Neolecta irregularis DAH-3]|uniref:Uncharacterized protein n=1 Tax=Neolecta irregularis (strain DAH-3) TaxID=1198029 RepID=A0A1U7LJC6_NEOID|nr:hypothetical protein NEOLI_003713 [Neolecta irregularis DAH-3]|eukprot:OLL22760.1 hypothetical protein NEOLI_003713 [Neolecta irregularis DAH-3]
MVPSATLKEEFDDSLNVIIPDDLRIWIAYDLKQRFGLAANDVYQIGVTAKFQPDVEFIFPK